MFEDLTGRQVPWDEAYLAPTANRDIVIRMLNNLKAVFVGRSDVVRLGMIMGLRATIPELADSEDAEIATASAIFN